MFNPIRSFTRIVVFVIDGSLDLVTEALYLLLRWLNFINAQLDALMYPRLHLIQPFLRPFLIKEYRDYILNLPPPPDIATIDILPLILSQLPRSDLVRCCRVSQLFLGLTGKELYGDREGVLVGKERYYHWLGDAYPHLPERHLLIPRGKPSLLAGYCRPEEFDVTDPEAVARVIVERTPRWPFHYFFPARIHPFQPSKLKLELLHHVRHLILISDLRRELDTIDSTSLFPHLHTLTIQHIAHLPQWDQPFLSNLRPTHIRLTRLFTPRIDFPLDGGFGSKVKRLTLHFTESSEVSGLSLQKFKWPPLLEQLDLVFATTTSNPPSSTSQDVPLQSFSTVRPPHLHGGELDLRILALEVILIILSASMRTTALRVRFIGLAGKDVNEDREDGENGTVMEGPEEQGAVLIRMLRKSRPTLSTEELRKVDFATFEEYRDEKDYVPL